MIQFKPFRGIRAPRDKVSLTPTRTYLSYSNKQLNEKLSNNPYTFLHVIHPPKAEKLKGKERFKAVREAFNNFIDEGIFIQEDAPAFYLYEQSYDNQVFRGWIGAVAVEDYLNGKIKVHENTLTEREEMFREYLEVTGFNAEPVLLAHRDDIYLSDLARSTARERPEYEFTTTDKVTHKVWVIRGGSKLELISDIMAKHEALYIADGHHRSASSALLGRNRADNHPASHFLAFLLPYSQLETKAFYRLLKSDILQSIDDLSRILSARDISFTSVDSPSEWKGTDGALAFDCQGKAIEIHWPEEDVEFIDRLATRKLYRHILKPIGNIEDDRNDKRLVYEPAVQSVEQICAMMKKKKFQIAFLPPPISFEDVMRVADAKLSMPPKSTYIEPKLRSGLVIYGLE